MCCVVRPLDDFHAAIGMFHQGSTAFDPIAIIAVQYSIDFAHFGMMDVTTDHTIHAALFGLMRDGFFEFTDEFDGVLDLLLQECRQRPIGQV